MGKSNWGLIKEAGGLIEKARANGYKITEDQYPYRFSSGYPYRHLIPRLTWVGKKKDEALTGKDIEEIFDHLRDNQLIELYKKVTPYIPISEHHQQFLNELPRKRLVSFVARNFISLGSFQGSENARERMQFLERMRNPEESKKIRQEVKKYALKRKAVTLSHVIRSQTSLPAQIMNWNDRGWIKEGYKADIAVFDLNNIRIKTSISNPHQYSEGVNYLLVNGKVVLEKGE